MKKKILALVLSVLMVLSGCSAMVVFAEDSELPANIKTDFEPIPLAERTDSIITDKTGWGQTGGLSLWEGSADNTTVYTISKSAATCQWEDDTKAKWAAEGLSFKGKIDTSVYKGGATLVLSADVKSHNDNNPKMTWGLYQNSYKSILPMEYPTRADGMETTSAGYKTFGATVYVPETCDVLGNTSFNFGFAKMDAPESSNYAVNIKRDSLYFAAEAASDIVVKADKTTVTAGKAEAISLDADILNQVDYTGNLSQEVTWYAMNEAKTEILSDIQIAEGANGTATVTLPATLAVGKYNIVAVSDTDKALVRTTTLTVEEAKITETTITEDGTNVTISAKDAIENAVLIFAKYDSNGRMLTADFTNDAVTVSANGTATIAIPAGFTTGNVKIMLWKDLTTFKPLAAAIE